MTTEYEQVLTEAIINAAVTGEKQAERVKFDPAIPFSKQTERMLKGRWAGVPPSFVLGLMRFSEHWDERLDDCSFEFRPDPAAGVDMKRVEELSSPEKQQAVKDEFKVDMSVRKEGGGYEFKMKMNGKLQGPFMGVFRKMFPAAKPAFGQGFLTGQFADEKTAVNAFAIGKKLMTSGPYKKGEAPQILDSKNDLPAEDIPEYEATVKAAGEGEAVVVIKGKCANIVNAYKELCDYAGIAFDAEVFNRQLKLNGNDTYVTYDMVWFVDALTEKGVPPDPDAKLQELRKARFGVMLNSFIRNSCGAQAKAKAGDMLEAGQLKPEDQQKAIEMMTLENLSKSTVQDLIGYAEGVRAKKKDGFKNVEPALRGECAKRRMKLFDDAEHYGAQIFCNGQWIAAIVRDYDQAHTFGRLKPKVDKKTGKIMPECNLRQDEGITKENLAIQEDPAWPWVKDGLGTAYDNMPDEMGQCVMGGVSFWGNTPQYCKWGPGLKPVANWNSSGYFQTKQRDELMPLIVYMECSTGKLFCSNLKVGGGQYSVGNGWYQYDFNTAINTQNDGGLRNKLRNASFKEIYNVANDASFEAYAAAGKRWNAIKDPPPKFSEGQVNAEGMLETADMDDNGVIILRSQEQARAQMQLLTSPYVSKVRLAFQDASGLFEDLNISNLETIDCSEVTDAESMFCRATVSNSLDLVSTKKVRQFSNMFSAAKNVQWLMGLDTRAATQMDSMFYGVETFRQRKLVLPDLDLSNCRSMRQAFAFSPVEKLSFVNPSPELSDMYRVIQGCYMLKQVPNLWFDSVKGNGFDTFGVDNAAAIFDGCDRLNEDPARLNEAIKDLEEWYAAPAGRELKRSQVDTDRYGVPMYVLETEQDVRLYLDNQRKYRGGLVLRPADGDACSWFDSASIEGIDVIDLTEVKNAQALFNEADIDRLGRIVGTENIINASYMFSFMSSIRTIPAINLASAEKIDGIFSNCPNIHVIKTGNEYRTKFNLDKVQSDEVDIAKLIFGDAAQIMIQRFGESLGEWLDPMKERVVQNAIKGYVEKAFDERGYVRLSNSDDYQIYQRTLNKYGQGVPEPKGWVLDSKGHDARGMFKTCTVDFMGKPLDFQQITSAFEMFYNATVKNLGGIENADDLAIAARMFCEASLIRCKQLSFAQSPIENADSMFMECECQDCGDLPVVVNFSNIKNGTFMFENSNVLPAQFIPIPADGFKNLTCGTCMFCNCGAQLEFAASLNLQLATNCDNMFRESLVRNKDGFTVNMPVAVAASNMFNSANGLTEISLNAPILSEAGSFAFNCENLALVGKIVAPQLRHAQDMFSGCNKLVQAIDFQIPANADMRGAFEGTPVTDIYGEDGEYLLAFLEK